MKNRTEQGFSFIDVMIALTILLVGVLTLGAAMTTALVRAGEDEAQLRAKQLVTSTLESIFSTRDLNTATFSWESIANDTDPKGVFLTGVQPVYDGSGPDGIVGTADDKAGPDNVVGTGDDLVAIPTFQRSITVTRQLDATFTPPADNLKVVTVTVTFTASGSTREQTITTYIARYALG